jgi:hypothetical protein
MALTGLMKDGVLRFVLNPDDETLEGWTQVAMPEGVAPGDATWNGTAIVEDLAPLTRDLLARIDAECGAFRARFITTIPGQESTYLEKEREARAWAAASGPAAEDYPMIAAEAAARGISINAQAALVIAAANAWRPLAAAIEALRMGAKGAVRAAGTRAAKLAAAAVDWEAMVP